MPKTPKNTGVILQSPGARDWRFEGISGGSRLVLAEDGQWTKYLPVFEQQKRYGFESMSCVSQSLCNSLEIYFRASFGKTVNFSDRLLAKRSGTTRDGNTFQAVATVPRRVGLASEESWPWTPDVDTWDEYYSDNVPSAASAEEMRFRAEWNTLFEWVEPKPESIMEAMKYGPIQTCSNHHAYVLYGYERGSKWLVFDTYPYGGGTGRREVEWGHPFQAAMLHTATESVPLPDLKNDTLVFEAGGPGRYGLYVGGRMFVDETAKILAQWATRNETDGMFVGAPVRTLSQEDFARFRKFDLKGNQLD